MCVLYGLLIQDYTRLSSTGPAKKQVHGTLLQGLRQAYMPGCTKLDLHLRVVFLLEPVLATVCGSGCRVSELLMFRVQSLRKYSGANCRLKL